MRARLFIITGCLLVLFIGGCSSSPSPEGSRSTSQVSLSQPGKEHFRYDIYYVRSGDTLSAIGRRHDIPWQDIQRVNHCSPTDLEVGQVLLIPLHQRGNETGGSRPRSPVTAAPVETDPAPATTTVTERSLHRGAPSSKWWWPTRGSLTRRYGHTVRGFPEPGVGISASRGTGVHAISDGEVICVLYRGESSHRGWGNVVAVQHADGIVSWYGCLSQIAVHEGDRVQKGEKIGLVGSSGAASDAQLALRLFRKERPINPVQYLP